MKKGDIIMTEEVRKAQNFIIGTVDPFFEFGILDDDDEIMTAADIEHFRDAIIDDAVIAADRQHEMIRSLEIIRTAMLNDEDKAAADAVIAEVKILPAENVELTKNIMSDYMFRLSPDFESQSNCTTVAGFYINEQDKNEYDEFDGYDYVSEINTVSMRWSSCGIMVLFKYENNNKAEVSFKLHRHRLHRCKSGSFTRTYGRIVGEFGELTIDLRDTKTSQKAICEKLNEIAVVFNAFCEEHPEVNESMCEDEAPVVYGMIA